MLLVVWRRYFDLLEKCDEKLANRICGDCSRMLCEGCSNSHEERMGHKTRSISTVKRCPEHQNQLLMLYCSTCACLVCLICNNKTLNGKHADHVCLSEQEVGIRNENIFARTKNSIGSCIQVVESMKLEKKAEIQRLVKDIERFDELHEQLKVELNDAREINAISKTSFEKKILCLSISDRKYLMQERGISNEKVMEMTKLKKDLLSQALYGEALCMKKDTAGVQILMKLKEQENLRESECGVSPYIVLGIANFALGDYGTAHRYFSKLVERKDPFAIYMLGYIYYYGLGGDASPENAYKLFKISAGQGFAPSQTMLGRFYEKGTFVKLDIYEACNYYQLASAQEYSFAFIRLGNLYEAGKISGKTIDDAKKAYQRASDIGNLEATELIKSMK